MSGYGPFLVMNQQAVSKAYTQYGFFTRERFYRKYFHDKSNFLFTSKVEILLYTCKQ